MKVIIHNKSSECILIVWQGMRTSGLSWTDNSSPEWQFCHLLSHVLETFLIKIVTDLKCYLKKNKQFVGLHNLAQNYVIIFD